MKTAVAPTRGRKRSSLRPVGGRSRGEGCGAIGYPRESAVSRARQLAWQVELGAQHRDP